MARRTLHLVWVAIGVSFKTCLMLVLVLALALTAAAEVLSTQVGRDFVARQINGALAKPGKARFNIDAFDGISLTSVEASVSFYNRRGRRIVQIERLRLRLDTRALVQSYLDGAPKLHVWELSAKSVALRLDQPATGMKQSLQRVWKRTTTMRIFERFEIDELGVEEIDIWLPKKMTIEGRVFASVDALDRARANGDLEFRGKFRGYPVRLSADLERGLLRARAGVTGRAARGEIRASAELARITHVTFDANVTVPELADVPWLRNESVSGELYARARGRANLAGLSGKGELELRARGLALRGSTAEALELAGSFERTGRALPTGHWDARISGLRAGPFRSEPLAVRAALDVSRTSLAATATAMDRHGVLVQASAKGALAPRRRFRDMPLEAYVSVPDRALGSLPVALPLAPGARVTARAELHGSIGAPRVRVLGRLRVQEGVVDVDASSVTLGQPRQSALALVESATVSVQRFPLQALKPIENAGIRGQLDASIYADGQSGGRSVANIAVSGVKVGDTSVPGARASLMLTGGRLAGYLSSGDGERYVRASFGARLAMARLGQGLKAIDEAEVALDARRFPLFFASPTADSGSIVVRGELDGGVRVLVPRERARARAEGSLRFSRGELAIPGLGPALKNVGAEVRVDPSGRIDLANFSAQGVRGRVQGSGQAQLAAGRFDSARFAVEGRDFEITVGGNPLGTVKGRALVEVRRLPNGVVELRYDIPRAELELPAVLGRAKPAKEDPTIMVGVETCVGRRVALPIGEPPKPKSSLPPLRVAGNVRELRITRRGQLEIVVRGNPTIELGPQLKMQGEVQVVEGWLNILGKRFRVERGTLRFSGGALSEASLVASATWVAEDGTRVRVGAQGTLGQLKTSLQSDPARPEAEIVQLILSGTGQETQTFGTTDQLAAPLAAAGAGVMSRVLNDALGGVSSNVQARVDTTDPVNPQPEFEVQASEKVSVRFTTSLGVTSEGNNRSTTTVDYRAGKRWVVSAERGNTGSTAVDVIWRFQY